MALISIIGIVATKLLVPLVTHEESGRNTTVVVTPQNDVKVAHLSGKQFLDAYLDIAGIPTACDGITAGVKIGHHYTEDQCSQMLVGELVAHSRVVMDCTPFDKYRQPYQIVAAVDFDYALGRWCVSTASKLVRQGKMVEAADWFLPWNKARVNGKMRPVAGLTKRRHREREYWLTGLVPSATPQNLNQRLAPWR